MHSDKRYVIAHSRGEKCLGQKQRDRKGRLCNLHRGGHLKIGLFNDLTKRGSIHDKK